jgi:hypothetical protein
MKKLRLKKKTVGLAQPSPNPLVLTDESQAREINAQRPHSKSATTKSQAESLRPG